MTEKHKTPWLKQWTLYEVEIGEDKADDVAEKLSYSIDSKHSGSWYIDFKNDKYHFIIYRGKIFQVDLQNSILYKDAKKYGISIGIPEHQLDFVS